MTHPSHAQMLNAMGMNGQGPLIPGGGAPNMPKGAMGGQVRNMNVGRQGVAIQQQNPAVAKTPSSLKGKLVVNQ